MKKIHKRSSLSKIRSVAVLWGHEGAWSIEAILGVNEFARSHGNWSLLFAPRDEQARLRLPRGWRGDGILVRVHSRQDRQRCLSYGVPFVDLETIANTPYHPRIGNVVTHDLHRCQAALSHFQSLQVKHIVCFNPPHLDYSQLRFQVFQRLAREAGYECPMFWSGRSQRWYRLNWAAQQNAIQNWLKQLSPGTGIFTADGRQGGHLAEWCKFLEIAIPDEVAIVTGDDDSLLCAISSPPLTGVVLAGRQHGYSAAALLQRMMDGEAAPSAPILIDPIRLIIRQSSDVLNFKNPAVEQASRYIRSHACRGINVEDVVRQVPISRRGLENFFLDEVGHTIATEIRRIRIETAKVELGDLNLSIAQVAEVCGFTNVSQFCTLFRREAGETPSSYRTRLRGDRHATATFNISTERLAFPFNRG